jgi:hypothetical protein
MLSNLRMMKAVLLEAIIVVHLLTVLALAVTELLRMCHLV